MEWLEEKYGGKVGVVEIGNGCKIFVAAIPVLDLEPTPMLVVVGEVKEANSDGEVIEYAVHRR